MLHSRVSSSLQSAALPLVERENTTEDMLTAENKRLHAEVLRLKSQLRDAQHVAGFKAINDEFGHAIGDSVLEYVGDILQSGVRHCDMVARLGGDEFGVLTSKLFWLRRIKKCMRQNVSKTPRRIKPYSV